ncbi:MAG TPA: protoheme IX farnesyltransferase, partial [Pseudonocardiaceae bacterium]|nr:protoheme IX farnesyltransferase [Pseudonocardiaceae bacterium]
MRTVDNAAAPSPAPVGRTTGPADVLRAYVALIKPRVIELLLVTALPAMFLAERGFPPLW